MKLLWICNVWPEPTSSAAGVRTYQLIKSCMDAGFEVQASSGCQSNQFEVELNNLGIKTIKLLPNDSSFDEYLKKFNPEVVVFDRFMIEEQFSWRVKNCAPNALRVLDTCDLHSLRRIRKKLVESGKSLSDFSSDIFDFEDAYREIASIFRSDLSLITSDFEMNLLETHFQIPKNLLFLSRLFYLKKDYISPFENRFNFVTIGNFNHPPNTDSFKVLKNILWDKIRLEFKRRDLSIPELHIYGAYPSAEFLNLNSPSEGFYVKGWTENSLETLSNYRINLAPLRYGAGVKGKILDGWCAGTPCIGTKVAAEGMIGDLLFGGYIKDSWDEFAVACADLYLDKTAWIKAQNCGFEIIDRLYNPIKNSEKFIKAILESRENLKTTRHNNFFGSILWHQSMRSTEYFSKWIEEKNKSN